MIELNNFIQMQSYEDYPTSFVSKFVEGKPLKEAYESNRSDFSERRLAGIIK